MRVLDCANAFWTARERMMMVKCVLNIITPRFSTDLVADWLSGSFSFLLFRCMFAIWKRIPRVRVKRRKKSHSTNVLPEVCTWEHFCATLRVLLILQSSSSHRAILKDFREKNNFKFREKRSEKQKSLTWRKLWLENKFFGKKVKWKIIKVANEVDKKRNSPSPITRLSADNSSPTHHNNNNCTKMPPAASPPVLSSWAPILFPPWNSGLLPAAFYPAALRSLPT